MSAGKLLVAAAVAAAVAAGYFYPPIRLFAEKAVGRGTGCPLGQALEADRNIKLQARIAGEILRGSRLLESDPAGYRLFQTPKGRWWVPVGDDYVLPFDLAEQARQVYGTGKDAVQPGDIALDCGANVGVWTRTALARGAKLVVAFEPAPENFECYRRNYREEIAAGRVILVPKGVWDKEDVLPLKRDPHNSAADSFVLLKDGSAGVQAPLTTIDRVVEELQLPRVDYIKMDIEGAEVRALTGAQSTIARFHPRLSISTEHLPDDAVKIPALVGKLWAGYHMACGPCLETKDAHVRPDVLYFR
jgi:FkbM family methyltransferase